MFHIDSGLMDTVFQSSPAPKDGRYCMGGVTMTAGHVSILARPEGRALPDRRFTWSTTCLFQSSPAPKDGRYRTTSPRPEIMYFSRGFRERLTLSLRCTDITIARFIQVIEK